jgi:phosphate transport system substrate-binding protein
MRTNITLSGLALGALLGCGPSQMSASGGTGMLTLKGSDTMVHLVTAWAEAYMTAHPESMIAVTGGGSGTGIAAMLNGTTGLCMASRDVKDTERAQAKERGVSFSEHVVARDAIALVVHPENPVQELSLDQLKRIFTGAVENWSQLGGPDRAIQALSRESNSGTYVFFNEHVCKKQDFGARIRLMPSNAAIMQAAEQDRGAIGYVGLGYAQQGTVAVVRVRTAESAAAVAPSAATVGDGSYGIARPLYLYSNGAPKGLAKAFAEFAASADGQRIVSETGYVPLK